MVMGMLLVRHDLSSAAVVRREVASDLASHSLTQDSVDDVVLVVSELVGNAVVHANAGGDADLDVAWDVHEDSVIVRVNDPSEQRPVLKQVDAHSGGGRGLAIVAALSAEWGVRQVAHGGKQVWARVPVSIAI